MKHCYFVDWENVGDDGFNGWEKLKSQDKIVLFIRNGINMSNLMKRMLIECQAKIELKQFNTSTKNAADFNIVAYLSYLIAKDNSFNYYIVSRDCGFKAAMEIIKSLEPNLSLELIPNIHNDFLNKPKSDRRAIMEQNLAPIKDIVGDNERFLRIVNICVKCTNLGDLNNKLVHSFKKDECQTIYKQVKPYYEQAMKNIV